MSSAFAPIKGKCTWWRESPVDEDVWDPRVKDAEKRVYCSCFVEGEGWMFGRSEVPENCPQNRRCRYYIRH
ncbi:MAG TPA: hypothetical protein VLA05_11010 [Coriobacteriia bacterium]|nr:hypothetical protein [Coriobacteriia bacterium]